MHQNYFFAYYEVSGTCNREVIHSLWLNQFNVSQIPLKRPESAIGYWGTRQLRQCVAIHIEWQTVPICLPIMSMRLSVCSFYPVLLPMIFCKVTYRLLLCFYCSPSAARSSNPLSSSGVARIKEERKYKYSLVSVLVIGICLLLMVNIGLGYRKCEGEFCFWAGVCSQLASISH